MQRQTLFKTGSRILAILFSLCSILLTFSSCSKPPEFSEIQDRFQELVKASAPINEIFFGEGLPTYERVTDPRETTDVYEKTETGEKFYYYWLTDETYGSVVAYRLALDNSVYVDEESGVKYFYYQIYDQTYGKIIVAKTSDGKREYYLRLFDAPKENEKADYVDETRGVWGYLLSDFSYNRNYGEKYAYAQVLTEALPEQTPLYADAKNYVYALDNYQEAVYESYYDDKDPTDYDYVKAESPYHSIDQIKEAAEAVYSAEYLDSLYQIMFVGTVGADSSVNGLFARYMDYTDESGNTSLMMSNTYEPLLSETRLYLFDTAELIKPSNQKFVTVAVDSYLPSKPSEILRVKVTMVLQDGVWMLDGPTY